MSVLIRDTVSIKHSQMHEGNLHEAENHFKRETYSPSAGAAGMWLHINGQFTTLKLKSSL